VDVRHKGLAFLPGDAAELDSSFPAAIELIVNQHIYLGLAGNPFCVQVVTGERLILEVLQEFLCPRGSCSFS
jgi:hypothetical protein